MHHNINPGADYIAINKKSWNNRTETHLHSDFYDVTGFLAGRTSLNEIELQLLGDISGKSILHLQCHFGQDTISLARLGARLTGVDLSDKSIASAELLAEKAGVAATFICSDIYDLPTRLTGQFDIVFTSYGTVGWLPDLDRWASVVAQYVKPGGKFVFAEFHPVVWMFDDCFKQVAYSYFNTGPIVETESGTYADRSATISQSYVMWNHSISEVVNSLVKHKLQIMVFNEYDYSPYDCFKETLEFEPKKFRIRHLDHKIPMVYAIVATAKR